MRPYIKQLLRLSQLYNDPDCERIWSKWLEAQEAWLVKTNQVAQDFSNLIADLSGKQQTEEEEGAGLFSVVNQILQDCSQVRNSLTPLLTKLIHTGIWATLKKSDAPTIAATLRDLGFSEDNPEVVRVVEVEPKLATSSEDHQVRPRSSLSILIFLLCNHLNCA